MAAEIGSGSGSPKGLPESEECGDAMEGRGRQRKKGSETCGIWYHVEEQRDGDEAHNHIDHLGSVHIHQGANHLHTCRREAGSQGEVA